LTAKLPEKAQKPPHLFAFHTNRTHIAGCAAATRRYMLPLPTGGNMAQYLFQVAYTPEAWSALVQSPQDRSKAVEGVIRNLGGKLERAWLSFGDYDVIGVMEMPDSVSAAAFSVAVAAGGACKTVKTTPLLTTAEGVEAMKKAATCGYKPVQKVSGAGS
jgi:uncharacterized protein with GYD domain